MRKLLAILLVVLMLAALCVCVFADKDPVYSPTATTTEEEGTTGPSDTGPVGPQTGFSPLWVIVAFVVLVGCAVASVFVIRPLAKKEN